MASIKKCDRGHFYDRDIFIKCPHCESGKVFNEDDPSYKRQVSRYALEYLRSQSLDEPVTVPQKRTPRNLVSAANADGRINNRKGKSLNMPEKTIAFSGIKQNNYFVAGWLVCIDGPDKGRSFNLYYGYNTIGSSMNNQICLLEDTSLSADIHCSIIYENRKNRFYLMPEAGHSTYVNGIPADNVTELFSRNLIRLGNTEFEFVAFCQGDRKWSMEDLKKHIGS